MFQKTIRGELNNQRLHPDMVQILAIAWSYF